MSLLWTENLKTAHARLEGAPQGLYSVTGQEEEEEEEEEEDRGRQK